MNLTHIASTRTIILFVLLVPVICYLVYFAFRKNRESAGRVSQCQESCFAQGYQGYDFKWAMLSSPKCECLGEPEVGK